MKPLLDDELRARLPSLHSQEGEMDPVVQARFFLPGTIWTWWVIEGEEQGGDFLFFGFVNGIEDEFGYFCLSELLSAMSRIGVAVERDRTFQPGKLTEVVPPPHV